MAPTKRNTVQYKSEAQKEREHLLQGYELNEESRFIAALSAFSDNILGTPITPEFPRAASFYAPVPAAILDEHVAKAARTVAAESELSAVSDAETEINVETELDDSDAETEDGGYTLCTGWCGRQMHHEDTDDSGACGRCQAEAVLRHWDRMDTPPPPPVREVIDLTEDSDEEDQSGFSLTVLQAAPYRPPAPLRWLGLLVEEEEDQSGYQSPAPLRCPGCGKLYCRMRGQHHVVVTDLTV